MRSRSLLLVSLLVSAFVGGCGTAASSGPATPTAPPAPAPTASPAPTPSSTPTAPPTVDPTATPTSPPAVASPEALSPGAVITTLADEGLRVRSRPGVGSDSAKLEPLVPLGRTLLVLQGPVAADGYRWFEVAPLESAKLPTGWVADGSRGGVPWIAATSFDCPTAPSTMRELAAMPPAVGLACFAGQPITVRARLIECNCDMDGSWYTPSWFYLGSGSPLLLVEPGATEVPADSMRWFALNLDPTGSHPDVLPVGEVVEVTGVYDHPAAAACTRTEMDGQPVPTTGCRLEFAVTRLAAS